VVARFVYEDGALKGTELHPITLGRELPRSRRGCPRLANAEDGARILERVSELSAPFSARVAIERRGEHVVGRIVAL